MSVDFPVFIWKLKIERRHIHFPASRPTEGPGSGNTMLPPTLLGRQGQPQLLATFLVLTEDG